MRKRNKALRLCWECYAYVDLKQPKTFVRIERTYWGITKEWVYHKWCWQLRNDRERMRKYRNRLRQGSE